MSSFPLAFGYIMGAVLLLALPRRLRPAAFLAVTAVSFYLLLQLEAGASLALGFLEYELVLARVDSLSLAFGYVFVIISLVGGVYSFHVKDALQQTSALLYAGGALGVVFAGDLFTLFVFWEVMAIASMCLILARRTPDANRAGLRYLLVHALGGSLLMAGILLHLHQTGSMAFDSFDGSPASYLILVAFAINAAIPPLHAWLSDAYPRATVTGAVFLSAFTTKTAVYVLARGFAGLDLLMWAGAIMAVYGVVFAILENDIRRLLAYHIISQVGFMVAAIGIGTELAINGATAHAFAHILYKALLFMGAGAVLYATGRSKLSELGGLGRTMPLVLMLFMIGAFSISGFPLFSGFVSKSMAVYAAERSLMEPVVLLLQLASIGTFFSIALKLPYYTWFGPDRGIKPSPLPAGMYIGMGLLAAANVAIGVYPALLYNVMPFPVDYAPFTFAKLIATTQLLVFSGIGFWLLRGILGGKDTITLDVDWFYRRTSRLAYTVFSVWLSRPFEEVDRLSLRVARFVARQSANPPHAMAEAVRSIGYFFSSGKRPASIASPFNPDHYRLSLSVMVMVMLAIFAFFLGFSYFN